MLDLWLRKEDAVTAVEHVDDWGRLKCIDTKLWSQQYQFGVTKSR